MHEGEPIARGWFPILQPCLCILRLPAILAKVVLDCAAQNASQQLLLWKSRYANFLLRVSQHCNVLQSHYFTKLRGFNLQKVNQHRGKGCGVRCTLKFQPPFDEVDFAVWIWVDELMKPSSVCSRRQQHHRKPKVAATLFHPGWNIGIGRVYKDPMHSPGLLKAVLFYGEEVFNLGVFGRGAGIEREVKFRMKLIKKILGCLPLVTGAAFK